MNGKSVLNRLFTMLSVTSKAQLDELTDAQTDNGEILQADDFDINEPVVCVSTDGTTEPAEDGSYNVSFTNEEGEEEEFNIIVSGGVIVEKQTIERAEEEGEGPEGEESEEAETTPDDEVAEEDSLDEFEAIETEHPAKPKEAESKFDDLEDLDDLEDFDDLGDYDDLEDLADEHADLKKKIQKAAKKGDMDELEDLAKQHTANKKKLEDLKSKYKMDEMAEAATESGAGTVQPTAEVNAKKTNKLKKVTKKFAKEAKIVSSKKDVGVDSPEHKKVKEQPGRGPKAPETEHPAKPKQSESKFDDKKKITPYGKGPQSVEEANEGLIHTFDGEEAMEDLKAQLEDLKAQLEDLKKGKSKMKDGSTTPKLNGAPSTSEFSSVKFTATEGVIDNPRQVTPGSQNTFLNKLYK